MDVGTITEILRETLWLALSLSAPVLAAALGTGLLVSVFQAATQINEQTLAFVPKIVATLLVFGFGFPHMMTALVDFTRRLLIPGAEQ